MEPRLTTTSGIERRAFGRNNELVSMLGLGGSHIGKLSVSEKDSIRIMRTALDNGINFFDNSWDYNNGRSETLMGKALRDGYRRSAFLMTKIDGRTAREAARQLDESLKRLQTDCIDLVQHHEIIRFEDVDRIFADKGGMEALVEAKRAGKLRYIGFTGHKDPSIHLYMLEVAASKGFEYDAVQMPLNPMDAHFRSFEQRVLPVATRQNISILGMKSMGGGILLKSGVVSSEECLRYALTLPTTVVITGIESMERLESVLALGRSFQRMQAEEIEVLLTRTRSASARGQFELFKTSSQFDQTALHPYWLGEQSDLTVSLAGKE